MTDDKEERREYRKNLLWACSVDSDAVANRITELELRIEELNADYAKLINHTDPDYVIGLQHRIKEFERWKPSCFGVGPYAPCERNDHLPKGCKECPAHKKPAPIIAKERANKHTDDKPEG